jgi:hypothetical protein
MVVAMTLVAAACSAGTREDSTSGLMPAAIQFAAEADRALDGSRFAEMPADDLADAIVSLCSSGGSIEEVIGELPAAPGDPADDLIIREVIVAGLVQVCPTQTGDASVVDAFLASVRAAIASAGADLVLDDEPLIAGGTIACASLDAGGGVDGAVLSVAAILFEVERSTIEELEGALDASQGIAVGAILASAALYFCPEHEQIVADFVGGA